MSVPLLKDTKPLDNPASQLYYENLAKIVSNNNNSNEEARDAIVTVRQINEQKGKGLFGTVAFQKGQVIFAEKPHVALQEAHSRVSAHVCAHCFMFLGSLEDQMNRHEQMLDEIEEQEAEEEGVEYRKKSASKKGAIHLPQAKTLVKTHLECFECFNMCGEVYCSEQCRVTAYANHHRLLCVGQVEDESHPLFLFKEHAVMNNELFLIAAQFITTIISEWENNGKDLDRAMQPFLNLHKRYYWDAIDLTINEGVSKETLMNVLGESLKYLRNALSDYLKQAEGGQELMERLLDFDFYSLVCGVLENNDQSIDIKSPLQLYLEKLNTLSEADREKAWNILKPLANRIVEMQREMEDEGDDEMMNMDGGEQEEEEEEEGIEDVEDDEPVERETQDELVGELDLEAAIVYQPYVFPSCQGLGMFALEATTNHSCQPNCIVKYESDNSMKLIALRDIEAGEELTHSYIEESAPLKERQVELKSYGFVCDCPKCIQES